jgi:hypothetical protein
MGKRDRRRRREMGEYVSLSDLSDVVRAIDTEGVMALDANPNANGWPEGQDYYEGWLGATSRIADSFGIDLELEG